MEKNQSPANGSPKKKRRRGKHPALIMLQLLLLLVVMGGCLAGGVLTGYIAALVKDEPVRSYDEYYELLFTNYLTGFAYFNDGTLIGQLRAEEDRRLVKIPEISNYLIDAIIATEDRFFHEHNGIVLRSTLRGFYQDLMKLPVVTGGSTITQQLIKNTVLSPEVSHKRKVKEIFNALRLERMFSKDQIMEAYLNEIYLGKSANGSNIYGVQAAAKGLFNKDVRDLNLAESSYLAGMVQNPGGYSPFNSEGFQNGKARQKEVLGRMLENDFITQAQFDQALAEDLQAKLAKPTQVAYKKHPHLMMEIEKRAAMALVDQQLAEEGKDKGSISREEYRERTEEKRREILKRGYHIHTTIDQQVNEIMENIASNPDNFGKNANYTIRLSNGQTREIKDALEEVGAVLLQNKTGAILGMIGGRDFNVEQTNHATVPRQPGSAMKPLAAYGPAFELGLLQPGSPIDDSPLLLKDGSKGSHLPLNWNRQFHGIVNVREALSRSWNVPAIKAYLQVGIPTALEYVKKMGVTTLVDSDYHAQTGVIGGLAYGTTVEEITNAFATFANRGSFIDAYMIERIEDSFGNTVFQHKVTPEPVFSEQTAYLITDIMRTVVNSGLGTHIRNYVPRSVDVAGKTGTTNNDHDVWFIGYTPELSMGVWVGYDEPYRVPTSSTRRAMQVWGMVMKEVIALESQLSPPTAKFERPPGIVSATIDSKSGLLPSELSREANHIITDLFNQKFVPTKVDDSHQRVKTVEYDGRRYLAKEETPQDFVTEGIFFRSPEPLASPEQVQAVNSRVSARPADWNQRIPDEEDPRTPVEGPPSTPGSLSVTTEENQVKLGWQASPEADVLGYRVYRSALDGHYMHIGTVKDAKVTSFSDPAGAPEYGYYVTAVDITGLESAPSNTVTTGSGSGWQPPAPGSNDDIPPIYSEPPSNGEPDQTGGQPNGQPQSGLPKSPKNVVASKDTNSVTISWAASDDNVILYNVYYSNSSAGNFSLIDSVPGTTYVNQSADRTGWYYVTAVNSYGESAPSIKVSGQ